MSHGVAASRGHAAAVDGFAGTVLAVFASAVYVAPTHGDLLVVHDAGHGHTPTSVLVDRSGRTPWPCRPGDRASGRAGHLRVGGLVLDVRQARVWSPPAAAPPLSPPSPASLRAMLGGRTGGAALAARCEQLVRALDRSDAATHRALRDLIGRGSGCTPSGDDAVVGVLAVLQRAAPPASAAAPLARMAATLPSLLHRTTPISAHFLRLALRGAHTEHLVDLVDAVARDGAPSPAQLRRVLATGASSGADALVGVVAALAHLAARSAAGAGRAEVAA